MGWRILIGITLLVGFVSAVSEYDNIPLETQAAQRKIGQRPFFTATYGVAPGEYVLRGSDDGDRHPPTPPQGFSFIQRDQPPPQEYLDLLRQADIEASQQQPLQQQPIQQHPIQQHPIQQQPLQRQPLQQHQQQKVASHVVDQQFFGVHSRTPYPSAGITPVSSLTLPTAPPQYTQAEQAQPQKPRNPVQAYPSVHNQVAPAKYSSTPLYVTPLPDTVPANPKKTKPTIAPNTRKTTGGSRTKVQDDSRQGSGKAVQLTYSLDYDLRTLHKEADSGNRPSSGSAPFYPTVPGKTVKGDQDLLRKLAPEPEPLPFPLSPRNNKKTKTKQSSSSDYDEDDQKVEVIKLPKNQRPITQEELNQLIRAGYDISPVEEDEGQSYQPSRESSAPQNAPGYPRNTAPQQQLRLPKSRPVEAAPQAPRYYQSTKTQEPVVNLPSNPGQNTYASAPASAPSAADLGYTYQTPRPQLPQTFRQKTVEPKVQAYQPGRSGIQDVNEHKVAHQEYQEEVEPQTQAYPGGYIPQGYPTAPAPQQPPIPQIQNYPTAAAQLQTQPQHQRVSAEQAQLYHHQQLAQQEVQFYQHPGTTESRNEALSQPKEYTLPAPQSQSGYPARGNQVYVPTAPSATGNDGNLGYHQALKHNQQQGYESAPTAPGLSAAAEEALKGLSQSTEGYGRRISRRRPSSQRESRVTYIRRYPGHTSGYTTEQ